MNGYDFTLLIASIRRGPDASEKSYSRFVGGKDWRRDSVL